MFIMQAKTNAIIIVIYLINVLYTCVLDKGLHQSLFGKKNVDMCY